MILDRALQRTMLEKLKDSYPYRYDFSNDFKYGESAYEKAIANLYYLQSHGLVSEKSILISGSLGCGRIPMQFNESQITHKGMDFLTDDGGLSAILGVVTIKFETEQLKLILTSKIIGSDLSSPEKKVLIEGLNELPTEGMKHLTTKIIDAGWDSLPTLMKMISDAITNI